MSRFTHFIKASNLEKFLFLEAAYWLITSKIAVALLPFKWIANHLRNSEHPQELIPEATQSVKDTIGQVSRAVQRTAAHLPGSYICLPQAIAAKMMLRRRRISNSLHLGATFSTGDDFKAHAWLKAGRHFVTGREEHNKFSEVHRFNDDFPLNSSETREKIER